MFPRSTSHAPLRARLRVAAACAVALAIACWAASSPAGAATGSTVVGATVPSSISLDDSACSAAASREFGNVTPGSSNLTATCRIDFRSSNDSSMLRMSRRSHDPAHPAMVQDEWQFVSQRAPTGVALWDIEAWSRDVAWAVGQNGTILATTNGGTTWPAQVSGVANHLVVAEVVSATEVWVAGDGGALLRTTNAGGTWNVVNAGTGSDLRDVEVRGTTVWVTGVGGLVRRSDDAGATWSAITGGFTGTVESIEHLSDSTVVLATSTPREIWRSVNRGASWTLVSTAGNCDWRTLSAASPTVVYVAGCSNNVGVSTDAGATWAIRTDGWLEGDDLVAVSPLVAYVTDVGGGIDRTYDGLATLPYHPNGTSLPGVDWITGLTVPSTDTVWFVDSDGEIGRSTSAATIDDYAAGAWGSAGTGLFGVCVQALGGTTIPVWAADSTGVVGTCEASDGDTWRAVPATPTKIAAAGSTNQGRIDLVWGLKPADDTPAGRYLAPITFEALAPNV